MKLKRNDPIRIFLNWKYYFWIFILSVQFTFLYNMVNCGCQDLNQPYNRWFFSSFQNPPWTQYITYYFYGHPYVYLAAPYSIAWYLFYFPATFGYYPIMIYLYLFNLAFILLLWKYHHPLYLLSYVVTTIYFTPIDPIDLLPFWFILLGRVRREFLILAPLVKLPLGAPLTVWFWVWNSPKSIHDYTNWGRYGILGAWWLLALFLNLRDSKRRNRRKEGVNPPAHSQFDESRMSDKKPYLARDDGRGRN